MSSKVPNPPPTTDKSLLTGNNGFYRTTRDGRPVDVTDIKAFRDVH